jgi:hypothetical protein
MNCGSVVRAYLIRGSKSRSRAVRQFNTEAAFEVLSNKIDSLTNNLGSLSTKMVSCSQIHVYIF